MIIAPTILSTVLTAVTKAVSALGPMIAKYAPMVITTIGKNLPKVINTIEAISTISNVLKPNESADELGARAIAAEKKPEEFDNINNYIDYLRTGVEIDEASLSTETVDVLTRQAVGATIAVKGVGENIGAEVSLPFLNAVSKLGLEPSLVISIIKSYSESNLNADDLEKYLSDKLSIEDTHKHSDAFISAYKAANPTMDIEQIEDAIMDLR